MMLSNHISTNTDEFDVFVIWKYLSVANSSLRSEKIKSILSQYVFHPFEFERSLQAFATSDYVEFKRLIPESFMLQLFQTGNAGGDFFWYTVLKDTVYFLVADCTGHGLSGTFMSILGSTILEQAVHLTYLKHPVDILNYADRQLKNILLKINLGKKEMWGMELAMVKIDLSVNQITYIGANRPLYVLNDDNFRIIRPARRGIGYRYDTSQQYRSYSDRIYPGTRIYLYTDGIVNQMGGPLNKKFKTIRLQQFLKENHLRSMKNQEKAFLRTFNEWKGNQILTDDALLLGIKL